jgi:hypothetical protein
MLRVLLAQMGKRSLVYSTESVPLITEAVIYCSGI